MGDFNLDLLQSNSHKPTEVFLDAMLSNYLFPYIIQPTRFTKNKTSTLIDNIFYNDVSELCISGNLIPHISDHLPNFLFVPLLKSSTKKEISFKRNFSSLDIDELRNDLATMNFNGKINQLQDADKMYNFFHNGLSLLFDMHIPIKKLSKKDLKHQEKPWIKEQTIKKIKTKHKLYSKFIKNNDLDVLKEYQLIRNEIKREIKRDKIIYLQNKFKKCKNNIKMFWKNINALLGKKKKHPYPSQMTYNSKEISDSKNIADSFNKHFSSVAPDLVSKIPKKNNTLDHLPINNKSFYFQPVSHLEVYNELNALKSNKAVDIFHFPIQIIKQISDLIAEPLASIINNSFATGIFPDSLKIAKVIPLFKSGSTNDIKNYRPISILPIFDKIFEKIMHRRLTKFLNANNLLTTRQYGFQKHKSTSLAVLDLIHNINQSKKAKKIGCAIFLDLAKAFDTVNHHILLKKLEKFGIRGPILSWFKSYLLNRKQCVNINGINSITEIMKYGVPQGSVLGPLLFLIYINDLVLSSEFLHFLFADDTCLFLEHENQHELEIKVNREIEKVHNWLVSNQLTLNSHKSCFLLFTCKSYSENFSIRICNNFIKRVASATYLGVVIDEKLNWSKHIDKIQSKVSQGKGILKRTAYLLPFESTKLLYYSFIQSHLQYCITSWGSPVTKRVRKLNKTVASCVNLVNKRCINIDNIFNPLNLLNLYKLESCKLIYNFVNNSLPLSFEHLFKRKGKANHHTRLNSLGVIKNIHHTDANSPIMFYGPQFWNHLRCNQNSNLSFSVFTNKLKDKLLNL